MKKYFYILFLLMFSCRKEEFPQAEIFLPGLQAYGFATGSKLATGTTSGEWVASGIGYQETTVCCNLLSIGTGTYDEFNQSRETLVFNFIPAQRGRYPILAGNENMNLPMASYARLVSHGDVIGASYHIEGTKSWIEITHVDTVSKVIRGTFDVRFKVGPSYADRGFPERVRFKDGQFDVKIIN